MLSPPDVPARSKGRIGAALVGATYTSSRNMFKNLPSPAQLKEKRLDPKNSIHEVINEQTVGPSVSAGRCRDEQTDKDSCVPRLPKESSRTSELLIPGNMKFPYPVCCCFIASFSYFIIFYSKVPLFSIISSVGIWS